MDLVVNINGILVDIRSTIDVIIQYNKQFFNNVEKDQKVMSGPL